MLNIISAIPSQFKIGYEAGKNFKLSAKNINRVVICGMGGSALAGDILKMWLENNKIEKIEIIIHKDYELPRNINNKNTLIICVSYSGNTEETLSSFTAAVKNKFSIIAITNEGGKLLKLAQKHNRPSIKINAKNIPPRLSAASQFSALLGILNNWPPKIQQQNLHDKLINPLSKLKISEKQIKSAKNLANDLKNKIILIYSQTSSSPLAYNLKINFNETSKTPAFCNNLPEINHNEIAGLPKFQKQFAVIYLKSDNDRLQITEKINILKKLLPQIKFHEIKIGDNKNLTNIFSAIIFFNLTAYFLAENYKTNPIKTEIIEKLKRKSPILS